jgi:hypothetical protein
MTKNNIRYFILDKMDLTQLMVDFRHLQDKRRQAKRNKTVSSMEFVAYVKAEENQPMFLVEIELKQTKAAIYITENPKRDGHYRRTMTIVHEEIEGYWSAGMGGVDYVIVDASTNWELSTMSTMSKKSSFRQLKF